MNKSKLYSILFIGLVLLLANPIVACGPDPSTVETPPSEPSPPSEQPAKKPAEFEVGSLTITPSGVMVGDSATVTTTVKNTGDVTGTYTAILAIEGEEADRKDVSVEPGDSEEVSFEVTKTSAGSYELTIGDSSAIMTVYDWRPYTIQYDKGEVIGWGWGTYVSGEGGQIVHFTPLAKPFRIQKIRISGHAKVEDFADWDKKQFTVRIWNKDKTQQLWSEEFPWRLFMGMGGWRDIDVRDILVNDDFHVEVVTHSDESPAKNLIAIHYEESEGETRSGISYMGLIREASSFFGEDKIWFIRAEGEGAPCLLSYDDGEAEAFAWSSEIQSGLVHFSPTSAAFELQKIMIYGLVMTKEPKVCEGRNFTVKVWDKATGKQLWEQNFPWKLFSGAPKWVEVEVPKVKCTGDFYVELTTNSTDVCRIYVGHDSSVPNRHSDMSTNGKVISWRPWTFEGIEYTREKANWMVRVEGIYK